MFRLRESPTPFVRREDSRSRRLPKSKAHLADIMRYLKPGLAVFLLGIALLVASCKKSPEELYLRREKTELASGIRHDSLFAGLYLGMPKAEFREISLNRHVAKQFREGGQKSGSWVEYSLPNELSYPGAINFYPEFKDDRISELRAAVYYNADVEFRDRPFDKNKLLEEVLEMLGRWYGADFIRIPSPDAFKDDIFVSVMGNRRITVYNDGDHFSVALWFVDLSA